MSFSYKMERFETVQKSLSLKRTLFLCIVEKKTMLLPNFRTWQVARSHRPWEVKEEHELRPSELYGLVKDHEDLEELLESVHEVKDGWEDFWHDWAEKISCHGFHYMGSDHKKHRDCDKKDAWPAIVIGAVVLAIILISSCIVCWKRRQQRRIAQQENFQKLF